MKRNKFVIIGLGNIGRELLKKISRDFEVTCIDLDPEAEEKGKAIRSDCSIIVGDATSRLVLEEAGVSDVDGIIITTTDEKVNLESATILNEHFESRRVIAIGMTQAGIEALEAVGAEVENIFTVSATAIRNKLEQTSRTSHEIGLGKNEILEVEVHQNSRLANRPLKRLTPLRWRIGIIYRDDNIIIPKSDTVLKPKDRVVILGDPAVLKTVSEILTFKFQQFPLEYGSIIIAYVGGNEDESFFQELEYLCTIFPLDRIVAVLSKKAAENPELREKHLNEKFKNLEVHESMLTPLRAIKSKIEELKGRQGLIVLSRDALPRSVLNINSDAGKKGFLHELSHLSNCPLLVTAGTFPYEKAAVPSLDQANLQRSLETALEIASSLNNEVSTLLVNPPQYISSDEDVDAFEEMKKMINEVSLMYKLSVKKEVLDGNPVKSVTGTLKDYNLMIADIGGWKKERLLIPFLNPDTSWLILKEFMISTLLLPQVEEAL